MTAILFEECKGLYGNLGIITLNRPEALNALNSFMVEALYDQLLLWETSPLIKAVIIRAAKGRAFCAGGDIKLVYENRLTHVSTIASFFRKEYQLNHKIYHYKKPYIAFLNGITMGGGAGISIHGSHRIATHHFVFAMPETAIGFFPDVGALYFLARLPDKIGWYLGLTGEKIDHTLSYSLKLIDHLIPPDATDLVIKALSEATIFSNENISNIIRQFEERPIDLTVFPHKKEIETCFSQTTVEAILHSLITNQSTWSLETYEQLQKKSPLSLKVTLKYFQTAKTLSLDQCLILDYRLMNRFLNHSDFFEGIRAMLVDKDRQPQWRPAFLNAVTTDVVNSYFEPLAKELM